MIVDWLAAVAPPEGKAEDTISTCVWPAASTNGTVFVPLPSAAVLLKITIESFSLSISTDNWDPSRVTFSISTLTHPHLSLKLCLKLL